MKKTKSTKKHFLGKLCNLLDLRKFERGKKIQFLLNVSVGLIIVLTMHLLQSTQWGERVLNGTFDKFIRMDAQKVVNDFAAGQGKIANTGKLLIVDMDYNKPQPLDREIEYISPRDTIARVIEMAVNGGAKVIVLNIVLERKDYRFRAKDEALTKVLETFPHDKYFPCKVIFAVRVGKNGALRKNIFDKLIDGNPNFYRAVPTLSATKSDAVIRYWKTFQYNGKQDVTWSIPVLAAALYEGRLNQLREAETKLIKTPNQVGGLKIQAGQAGGSQFMVPLKNCDLFRQRIRFPLIPMACIDALPRGNMALPTLERLEPRRFKDKILIMGTSDPEKGDIHPTPIGHMSGLYIQANVLTTLFNRLQPVPIPFLWALILEILVIIGSAYIFHYIERWPLKAGAAFILTIVLGFFSYNVLFRHWGIFFTSSFGIAAAGFFDSVSQLKETFIKKGEAK